VLKAAEHYETYLAKVKAKRAAGEALEPNVEKQETEAEARLSTIAQAKGRIHVKAGERPIVARVDNAPPRVSGFVVYVEPGRHSVRLGADRDAIVRELVVRAGELAVVEPPSEIAPPPPPPLPSPRFETRIERPFSPLVLWVSGGVALASAIIPVVTYSSALSIKSSYDDPGASEADQRRLAADYDSARTNAYATLAIPTILTAVTAGLALWYVLGAREARIPISAAASGVGGRF
jgi:hypothetical protein